MNKNWKAATLAVQAGYEAQDGGPRVAPIVQSTTYRYDTTQSVADLFDLKRDGFFYSRLANPTVDVMEKKIAALEGGVAAVALSSGQTANTLAIMNIAKAGDHVVASAALYGGTVNLFTVTLPKMGIKVTLVDSEASEAEIAAAVRPNTRAIFAETIANPALTVLDFEKFSNVARRFDLPFIVDNTFPTPVLCNPFEHGANIVTHSTTKYLDGHATSVGGVVVEGGNYNWANGKYPELSEPDPSYHGLVYTEAFPGAPYSVKMRVQLVRDLGCIQAPMNAWLTNLGMETLALRMERHSANALAMAEFLQNHPKVAWVSYPMLPGDSQYERAQKYLRGGSGVLSFGVKGGKEAAAKLLDSLKLAALVVHVADVRTCVLHPASMTHRQLTEEQLVAAGVKPELVRLSVGIEDVEDLKADFEQALAQL
ncbi:MAG: O-acetylhomoserine aminocarboxypropyltransferase/cysteine synthase [Lentisphaerae bacterium]|nr:O-acetylhomoserine aminocarboxypropyltransferase/cysteine synthase [Lentisphaerota bacterium]